MKILILSQIWVKLIHFLRNIVFDFVKEPSSVTIRLFDD